MKARKTYKCFVCKASSCGNDFHTRTKYAQEDTVGDSMKVILLQIYDLIEKHNLQKHEVLGLIKATLDEHIDED